MTAPPTDAPRAGAAPPDEGTRSGALRLERLVRRFAPGGAPAVDDVTIEARAGELLAVVGAPGSGKTTTLRMAAGYEAPDSGRVLLDGQDITRLPPERRGFGMVFQHYALFPHLSVEDNVAFGLEARGVRRAERIARAREALSGVGLGQAAGRRVQQLSGGEQQRVALARALVIEPRVLLLDEPLSNLDPTLRESTRDELRSMLRRLHVTALFVTHDQEDAFAIADRVALMRGGRLLQAGTPETLYGQPASRAVAEFIGRATIVPARAAGGEVLVRVGGVEQAAPAMRAEGGPGDGEVLAVLRPELLALAAPDDAGAWPASVLSRRFAGAAYAYRVRLADGSVVEVSERAAVAADGDRVGVRLVEGATVAVVPVA
jgi:ABC-type Fe3+/spermidine/putrescine transport system ATPase subunit